MGRCSYYTIGYGMTEQEARQDALRSDQEKNGNDTYGGGMAATTHEDDSCRCLVKPIRSKTCKVVKQVQKGARKWETVYKIDPKWGFTEKYNPIKHAVVKTTQGDAIKKAKAMAIEFGEEFVITIEKQLVGDNCIANVAPKKSQMGKWEFTGTARE